MTNTYVSLRYHIVFSTKERFHWITQDIEERVWAYIGGIAKDNGLHPIQIGGVDDHLHCLIGAPPTIAPAKMAQLLKGGSSRWIGTTFPNMRGFAWQDGYGAFTVSASKVSQLIEYIRNQRKHHQSMSFREEYLLMLQRHGISYDERYLWG